MYALAFDLDDTLLNDQKRIGTHTARVLRQWLAAGRHLFLATSRPIRAVERFIEQDILERCHIVTLNGAVWQYGKSPATHMAKLGSIARQIVEHPHLQQHALLSIEFAGQHFASNKNMTAAELDTYHSATPDMLIPLADIDYAHVSKIAVDGMGASLMAHIDWINATGARTVTAVDGTFLNVLDPNTDKATTLTHLLDMLGIAAHNLIAFGDDIPDLDMLRLAGTSVVMANGKVEVKAIADHIIGDCNSDCIGAFILNTLNRSHFISKP